MKNMCMSLFFVSIIFYLLPASGGRGGGGRGSLSFYTLMILDHHLTLNLYRIFNRIFLRVSVLIQFLMQFFWLLLPVLEFSVLCIFHHFSHPGHRRNMFLVERTTMGKGFI